MTAASFRLPHTVSRLLLATGIAASATAAHAAQPANTGKVWAEGTLQVQFEDGEVSSRLHHFLDTSKGRYQLKFKGEAPTTLKTGSRVRVTGLQSGAVLALDGSTSVTTVSPAPLPYTLGERKVAILLVNFTDNTSQPYTLTDAGNVLSQTNGFMKENASNQTWLSGASYGWLRLPIAQTCDTYAIGNAATTAASAAGIGLSGYSNVVYVFPRNTACAWAGMGTVGGSTGKIWINGALTLKTLAHELGHNLGLYHSHSQECGASTLGSSCTTYDYGDTTDDMGNTNASHYNAFQKERLGWLNNGTLPPITTVTASGSYTLSPYAAGTGGVKALKILKSTNATTGAKTWYYVEFRQAVGYDAPLGTMAGGNVTTGVVIHTGAEDNSNSSNLLDLTPSSSTYYDWNDPALVLGQSYSDSAAGITITPTVIGSTGATVNVTLGGATTTTTSCVRAAPTITPATQSLSGAAGSTLSYSVTVTNKDSGACSASTFNLAATAPTGWSKSFTSATLSLAPGASATTTLKVTSPTTATGSTTTGISASNGSVAGYTGSASATYSVSSTTAATSLTLTASTDKTSYTGNQTVLVSSTVKAGTTAVAGTSVMFTVTSPTGSSSVLSATTDSTGKATVSYRLPRKATTGSYQVKTQASYNGLTGTGSTSFSVQ